MNEHRGVITVYYDGACPECIKSRYHFEKLAGSAGENIDWLDITGRDDWLRAIGIDPQKALMELHVQGDNQQHFEINRSRNRTFII
jgi:hypothetical protein